MYRFIAFLIFAVAVACAMPARAQVDSDASGVYLGSDRVCRVVLSRYQTSWVQVSIRCLHFDGTHTESTDTALSPGTCPQPGAYRINPWPGNVAPEYLSMRGYNATDQALQIVRGSDQNAVYVGVGTSEAWYRIGWAPSSAPFTCAPPAPPTFGNSRLAEYCRLHPNAQACRG